MPRVADYGLLALTYLAHQGKGRVCYRNEIAGRFRISQALLAKILQKLRRGGILRSHLGAHGGYSLARPAASISLAEVLRALDAEVEMPRAPRGAARGGEPGLSGRLAAGLEKVHKDMQRLFSDVTIADLVEE
jgi:Rrf2 family protein